MYISALRPYAWKRLEEIEKADILVGIPAFNNEKTIVHVVQMVSHGLNKYFKDRKSVIMIADGGSTDDTRGWPTGMCWRPANARSSPCMTVTS